MVFSTDRAPSALAEMDARLRSHLQAGLVCGILSICFCCGCCFPVDLLGLIFSLIALVQISENPDRYAGRSMAIVGLVLSIVSFLFFLVSLATNHYNNNQFHYNIDNFRNF